MKKIAVIFLATTLAAITATIATANLKESPQSHDFVSVVPAPASVQMLDGSFSINAKTVFSLENDYQKSIASQLLEAAGYPSKPVVKKSAKASVHFVTDHALAHEAYTIDVSPKSVLIQASDDCGFFYALQTLKQLLDEDGTLPALHLADEPRFGFRGVLLDPSRYFIPKDEVLKIIDAAAAMKLNKVHLHLTDDNGWRIEIKRYPKLTEVGAWRVDRPDTPFPARRNPQPGEPATIGGFYTQDDIREIVAFAAERHIEVIPEIDMPAHANAALAAYPEYACPVVGKYIGVLPGIGGDNADIIYCAGNDGVFEFLQNILDEVLELFPSQYIHLGGDEAWKTHWKICPRCQARMKAENLADEEELQGWFMARMCDYVRGKGREVIGWDELTNSRLPEGVIIAGWQGMGQAALKAAAQGHRFIMTPARLMYFIRYQGPQWFEPATYFAGGSLKDVYEYEPVRPQWPAEYENLLMGVQACMWTEFCNSTEDVEYQLFPRLVALSEVAWCGRGNKNWEAFLKRLDAFVPQLEERNIIYARSMYNIQQTVTPEDGALSVSLSCIRPDVEIRYTTDGSTPAAESALYEVPLLFRGPVTLKAATFAGGRRTGAVLELPLRWNKATAKRIVNGRGDERLLLNGVRGSVKQTDLEWCSWDKDDVTFTVDLGESTEFSRVSMGFVTNYGMAVTKPASVRIEVSDDNGNFTLAAERSYTAEEIFAEGSFTENAVFETGAGCARYIRISLAGAGPCPADHTRPGKATKYYVDEVTVE
ncbi:MAG: family 20 glycosylhydrolase [Alistipes sp.]|nr:family 20 glycosylhydrolase [Alistipes sp.]